MTVEQKADIKLRAHTLLDKLKGKINRLEDDLYYLDPKDWMDNDEFGKLANECDKLEKAL